jgi:hypothetical protein
MKGEYSLGGGVVGFEGSHEKEITSKRRSYMRMKECAFFAEGMNEWGCSQKKVSENLEN